MVAMNFSSPAVAQVVGLQRKFWKNRSPLLQEAIVRIRYQAIDSAASMQSLCNLASDRVRLRQRHAAESTVPHAGAHVARCAA